MTTLRDFEFGERPACNRCGCELDPETDCHHDGYKGSQYAHNGRGSYGLGSHHYVFRAYCENCAELPAPLQSILQYDSSIEWLACGHTHSAPHDRYGRIRPGNSRRCGKCKSNCEPDFDAPEMLRLQRKEAFAKKLEAQRNCSVKLTYRTTEKNWQKYIASLGLTIENCYIWDLSWWSHKKNERAAMLQKCLLQKAAFERAAEAHEFAYNNDDH